MPNIVESTDFTGSYKVATDQYSEVDFEAVRDEWQFDLIYKLMGSTLGALFIANLNSSGIPTNPIYLSLFNAFTDDHNSALVKSEGIKAMVKYDVYFRYARMNNVTVATTGNLENKSENSQPQRSVAHLVKTYNQAIATAQAIQWYICQNSAVYPDYNGQELEFISLY